MNNKKFMQLAIDKAIEGIKSGGSPFGACIVKNNKIVSCDHNIVWQSTDITAHAEINAIRHTCTKLNTIDLSECTIYSTCEPCPMCFSACHWARIKTIIFGAKIKDAQKAGFNELLISNQEMKELANSKIEIIENFMLEENLELFEYWKNLQTKKSY